MPTKQDLDHAVHIIILRIILVSVAAGAITAILVKIFHGG